MPLTDLAGNLSAAIDNLDAIGSKLITPQGLKLRAESRRIFEAAVKRKEYLEDAIQLLEVRSAAKDILDGLRRQMLESAPVFEIHGVTVRFPIARLMLFQNVVCSNWALYDRVAGACGIMCTTDKVANNTKRSPNLLDFGNSENIAAKTHEHLRTLYGWNLCLSYQIRNWVVHSGETDSSLRLFEIAVPSPDAFKIRDEAWTSLVNLTKAKFNLDVPDITILTALQADAATTFIASCDEVDKLCSFLVGWSTGSLKLQLDMLCS